MKLPKLALIHDICGIGHCSMTVALPIVSVMGIQACPVPTAIFSNHTGYSDWYKVDLSEHLSPYLEAWNKQKVSLDGIYCGYLGSGEQLSMVLSLVKSHPDTLFFLDPVMGDHGRLYRAITPQHVAAMKTLVSCAQYIVPNITEACVLTDTAYQEHFSSDELHRIASKLHTLGPSQVVITGIREGELLTNFISIAVPDHISDISPSQISAHTSCVSMPVAGRPRPGTGDIFASVLVSEIINKQPLEPSVQKAAQFVSDCIKLSDINQIPEKEGTCFELLLPTILHPQA